MMIFVGLLLIPVSIGITSRLNALNTKKEMKVFLNIILLLGSFLYIVLAFAINAEPFKFEITRVGDYFLYSTLIFEVSPFLWINLYYYCRKLFRSIRVHKNAKIKSSEQYGYYRDDLNKISPSIVMFTSIMDTDIKKSISATILKLKLTGYIQEKDNKLECTNKNNTELLESEKIIMNSVKNKTLDEKLYKNIVEKEALNYKYLRKNKGGRLLRIIKILITIFIPIILINSSSKFDDFVFKNYRTYIYNGVRYVSINNGEIGDIYYGEVENIDDYYHGYVEGRVFYDKALVRANAFEYSFVRTTAIMQGLDLIFILITSIMVFVCIFMVIEQIIYFNKNYTRTMKGKELLNKAYALKNYLKDYSLIKNRTKEELTLWEYYLVYAVILDVNVKIKDDIIENYLETMVLK